MMTPLATDPEWLARYRELRRRDTLNTWKWSSPADGLYVFETPNQATIEISQNTNWDMVPEVQYQSTLLWLYSLVPLRLIAENVGDFETVNSAVLSFERYLSSKNGERRFATLTSRDHTIAEYLRTLAYLMSFDEFASREAAGLLMERGLRWGVSPGNIANNNHGMMLAMSILHVTPFIAVDDRKTVETIATDRLLEIISSAFDDSGLCVENSPAYHAFYIRYMKEIVSHARVLGGTLGERLDFVEETLARAVSTLEATALPDGALPSLGDGNTGAKLAAPKTDLTFFSKESGFFSHKEGNRYFSMKCGMSSITHKHMDDNSVYLWSNGEPVLLDAGIYNYDWRDRFTVAVKSQRGHSGPYFVRFDELYPGALYRPNQIRIDASMSAHVSSSAHRICGKSTIDHSFTTMREVRFSSLRSLEVIDEFSSTKGEGRVIRFLIPDNFSLSFSGKRIVASSQKNVLTIDHEASSLNIASGADSQTRAHGWRATAMNVVERAWAIELIVSDARNAHLTMLEIADVA